MWAGNAPAIPGFPVAKSYCPRRAGPSLAVTRVIFEWRNWIDLGVPDENKKMRLTSTSATRVRMRRRTIGMSREKLGDVLGLTYHQVQKYENWQERYQRGPLA